MTLLSSFRLLRTATQARCISSAQKNLAAAIEERYACKAFLSTPVSDETLKEILKLTLRAPTGFNVQPYVCVLVHEPKYLVKLAEGMMDR
ncbi:uncharacterized protein PITG_22494 [Phytophthora infestans T30-4]|uniref:Nitroreductase domain-containing protein n=1 Tax=Phytophthora infestans (strain T30-4) TaxID=403677 RepID=D0RME6_PHYIT|nr:uncharacterized protein PITG_22494 [Phytophthora infestans T30-4]EEY62759.1 conserved hypothetical protein [Phytophthora infestans T30-4]|eukprot:XP_002909784.1 conserved hypothetical protein [Phytophthora infestans T30-4]